MSDSQNNGWRIKSWDRSAGRGTITSPQLGELPFDASVALVDDFVVGEQLLVELEPSLGSFRVRQVAPDDPRIAQSIAPVQASVALRHDLAAAAVAALARIPIASDFRALSGFPDLIVQGDDDCFAHGHVVEITFRSVGYLDLPAAWDGKSFRLANDVERGHVATRTELGDSDIAVRIADGDRRIYFVTCASVEVCLRGRAGYSKDRLT